MKTRAPWALIVGLALATPPAARADVSQPHPGITLVQNPSRAMVIADLCASGVAVRATRYDERKQTAQGWAQNVGAQAAINADFFDFPAATLVVGRARGDGQDWPPDKQYLENRLYWQFGLGQASLVLDASLPPADPPWITQIVGGHILLIENGVAHGPGSPGWEGPTLDTAHRRTGVGISEDRRTLYLMAIDAEVTGSALVLYMIESAAQAGAPPIHYATLMDGGGSTEMYVQGPGFVIPSSRLVANHLGVYASGAGPAWNCVPKYAGWFTGQSFPTVQEVPISLELGEGVAGWFDLVNTGTATWTTAHTHLAPIPRDQTSPLADPSWISASRAVAVTADTPPGATGRFEFTLRANEPGDYVQHFGLVEEGVTWFADPTLGGGPADDVLTVHVVVPEGPPATDQSSSGEGNGGEGGATTSGRPPVPLGVGGERNLGSAPGAEGGCSYGFVGLEDAHLSTLAALCAAFGITYRRRFRSRTQTLGGTSTESVVNR